MTAPVIRPTVSPLIKLYSAAERTEHIECEDSHATVHTINFTRTTLTRVKPSGVVHDAGNDPRPRTSEGKLLTDKQIRARARRKYKRLKNAQEEILKGDEFEWAYKPVEEWSMKELAMGRPLPPDGVPKGPKPRWVDMEVHEKSMDLFMKAVRTEMNANTVDALTALQMILSDDRLDARGKPLVGPSIKLDAAKFLLEHVVGKPRQHVTQDISIKLQGLLGTVMVNPNDALAPGDMGGLGQGDQAAYSVAHYPGHTFALGESIIEGEAEYVDD